MTPKEKKKKKKSQSGKMCDTKLCSKKKKKTDKQKNRTDIGNFGNVRLMGRGNGSNFSVVLSFRRVGREGLLRYQR